MCLENIDALRHSESKGDAISLYKKTIDWALEENYPPIDFIRQEFGDCEEYGVFVDKTFHGELLNEHQCYVFHNCSGNITVDINLSKKIIPMLYFANGCDMSISRADVAHIFSITVPLYIFGDNRIKNKTSEEVLFKRYQFEIKGGR